MTGKQAIEILTTPTSKHTDEERMSAIIELFAISNAFDSCLNMAKHNGQITYETMAKVLEVHELAISIPKQEILKDMKKDEKPAVGRNRKRLL